jgi:hypothetical protein
MAGAAAGVDLTINGTQTIQASDGMLDTSNGISYRVFHVTSYQENDGKMLTINGDAAGDNVVFNFSNALNLGGDVTLTGVSLPIWFCGTSAVTATSSSTTMPQAIPFRWRSRE